MVDGIKSIEDLFYNAGGSVHVAALLNVNQWTVERWRRLGIPDTYWPQLTEKLGYSKEVLAAISNKAIRLNSK